MPSISGGTRFRVKLKTCAPSSAWCGLVRVLGVGPEAAVRDEQRLLARAVAVELEEALALAPLDQHRGAGIAHDRRDRPVPGRDHAARDVADAEQDAVEAGFDQAVGDR